MYRHFPGAFFDWANAINNCLESKIGLKLFVERVTESETYWEIQENV